MNIEDKCRYCKRYGELQATVGSDERLYLMLWCGTCGLHSHTVKRTSLHRTIEHALEKHASKKRALERRPRATGCGSSGIRSGVDQDRPG